jgi:hypothetical protein
VRSKIAAGILAGSPCAEVWGGRGTGSTCGACDALITAPAFEYECRSDGGLVFWLCQRCLYVWDAVIRAAEDDRRPRPASSAM